MNRPRAITGVKSQGCGFAFIVNGAQRSMCRQKETLLQKEKGGWDTRLGLSALAPTMPHRTRLQLWGAWPNTVYQLDLSRRHCGLC